MQSRAGAPAARRVCHLCRLLRSLRRGSANCSAPASGRDGPRYILLNNYELLLIIHYELLLIIQIAPRG